MKRKKFATVALSCALLCGAVDAIASASATLNFPDRKPVQVSGRNGNTVICPQSQKAVCPVHVVISDNGTITATVGNFAVNPQPYVDPNTPPNANTIANNIGNAVCSGDGAPIIGGN